MCSQEKMIHCFQVIVWNLTYLCIRSVPANDKDIANYYGNFFQTEGRSKAVVRPQNIGFKAAVAKRPHFAHGCYKLTKDASGELKWGCVSKLNLGPLTC